MDENGRGCWRKVRCKARFYGAKGAARIWEKPGVVTCEPEPCLRDVKPDRTFLHLIDHTIVPNSA